MGELAQRESLLERRAEKLIDTDKLWEHLTLAQKFSASSLVQFGYELCFIRSQSDNHLAVLCCNDNVAVIANSGEINTHPKIKIRL